MAFVIPDVLTVFPAFTLDAIVFPCFRDLLYDLAYFSASPFKPFVLICFPSRIARAIVLYVALSVVDFAAFFNFFAIEEVCFLFALIRFVPVFSASVVADFKLLLAFERVDFVLFLAVVALSKFF